MCGRSGLWPSCKVAPIPPPPHPPTTHTPSCFLLLRLLRAPQVFRTYNASIVLDRLLREASSSETVEAKKVGVWWWWWWGGV